MTPILAAGVWQDLSALVDDYQLHCIRSAVRIRALWAYVVASDVGAKVFCRVVNRDARYVQRDSALKQRVADIQRQHVGDDQEIAKSRSVAVDRVVHESLNSEIKIIPKLALSMG